MERRLRPIYDWLDSGNNKKALQEAEKVLKKTPTLQTARALKALSLLRLGRLTESEAVLEALANESPSDDSTLQAMTMSYKENQQLQKVCTLYEKAIKVDGANEELHSHLFMSYVRIGDYKSQQRAAMALYKFSPKNPYYFWAVMSIVLQAKEIDDTKQKTILLALAQRMVENFIADNKMEAEQEARLYVMILEIQEKWENIVNFMEKPLYSNLVPGSMPQSIIPYLKNLNQWRRVNILCKELLVENPDRWDYYLPYLDSVFKLIQSEAEDGKADDTLEKSHEFIGQLIEGMPNGKRLRGPYLARLELWKRLVLNGDDTSLLGNGVSLCVQYLMVFAHKYCAIPDLRGYLSVIPQKEREEHCRAFLTCLGFDEKSEPDKADDIQRHLSCIGAWRICGAPFSAAEAVDLGIRMHKQYMRALANGLVTSTATEFCAADGYALLAAHHYFYAGVNQKSSSPILEALCLLELVLHKSPANFHVKLLLMTMYHLIGNALAADTIYQRLQVKHIQLLSLGWLHTARLVPACALTRALQLLADTKGFHDHQAKDCMEHLTFSYKFGTFDKLVELIAWNDRIKNCYWSAYCSRERCIVSLMAGPAGPLHTPTSKLPAHPTDNRDLSVMLNWEPPQFKEDSMKADTLEQEVAYLRLKDGLMSSVALCVQLADSKPLDEKKEDFAQLMECTATFANAIEICKHKYSERPRLSLSDPFPSRIIAFIKSEVPYRELYLFTLRIVGEMALCRWQEMHNVCQHIDQLVVQSRTVLRQMLDERLTDNDILWVMREVLEEVSNYLEYLGIAIFILGVCHEMTLGQVDKHKKNKKKSTSKPQEEVKACELLNRLNQTLQDTLLFVISIFQQLPTFSTNLTLEQQFSTLNLVEDYTCCVEGKLRSGYCDMANDIIKILTKKLKYLKVIQAHE